MATDRIDYNDIIAASEKQFIENTNGYSIGILTYNIKDGDKLKEITEAGYHLHFLYSYDSDEDIFSVLCLDLNETVSISNYLKDNETDEQKKTARYSAIERIFGLFVNRSRCLYSKTITPDALFDDKSKEEFWNAYAKIKEQAYFEGLKKFADAKTLTMREETTRIVYIKADRHEEIKAELELEYYEERKSAA